MDLLTVTGVNESGCGGTHAKDWPLEASTSYLNVKAQLISTTSDLGVFPETLQNPIGNGYTWTGLSKDFQADKSCKEWTDNDYDAAVGDASLVTNSDFINVNHSKSDCGKYKYLYCVEVK